MSSGMTIIEVVVCLAIALAFTARFTFLNEKNGASDALKKSKDDNRIIAAIEKAVSRCRDLSLSYGKASLSISTDNVNFIIGGYEGDAERYRVTVPTEFGPGINRCQFSPVTGLDGNRLIPQDERNAKSTRSMDFFDGYGVPFSLFFNDRDGIAHKFGVDQFFIVKKLSTNGIPTNEKKKK